MEHELDVLIDKAIEFYKARHAYNWMPTKRNKAEYIQQANELHQIKKSITTAMGTDTNKINIHSQYNTEER
ncbi:hypothetical protein [Companilactobacillus ginsenosidimutans]|uniref:Uncharacterized protein n=1 Tax=Companilactobacillus ginsenosidimutans TaxID=1007676 RepID=A0A0H4QXX4_9LACO|nr:hypothetical protein [Companilactobacillus ginsenosidimutans]AKP66325.1 hypothetical protein ABM34_01330 [Companilactobacillus ginsenosidimutans]